MMKCGMAFHSPRSFGAVLDNNELSRRVGPGKSATLSREPLTDEGRHFIALTLIIPSDLQHLRVDDLTIGGVSILGSGPRSAADFTEQLNTPVNPDRVPVGDESVVLHVTNLSDTATHVAAWLGGEIPDDDLVLSVQEESQAHNESRVPSDAKNSSVSVAAPVSAERDFSAASVAGGNGLGEPSSLVGLIDATVSKAIRILAPFEKVADRDSLDRAEETIVYVLLRYGVEPTRTKWFPEERGGPCIEVTYRSLVGDELVVSTSNTKRVVICRNGNVEHNASFRRFFGEAFP